jgi:hypothetical protein
MMFGKSLFGAIILLAATSGAGAADQPGTPPPASNDAAAQPKPDADSGKDIVVCRDVPPPTGTRLGKRHICMTQQRWDDLQKNTERAIDRVQQRGTQAGNPSGG